MLGGADSITDIAKNLPPPVGTIASVADKGISMAEKLTSGSKKQKKQVKSNVGDAVALALGMGDQSAPTISTMQTSTREQQRAQRKIARAKARLAKRNARSDGYSKYTA